MQCRWCERALLPAPRRASLPQLRRNGVHLSGGARHVACSSKFTNMTEALYSYVMDLQPEPRSLRNVSEYTKDVPAGHMKSSPEQVRLFALLLKLMGARRAIEIGVFTGYSALGIAQALPGDGVLYAFERDPEVLEVAKAFWDKAGVGHKIRPVEGNAVEEIQRLLLGDGAEKEPFDFAFIDANKRAQMTYYEQCLELVRPGGLVIVDNVLWYGRVVDGERNDKITLAIRELNEHMKNDERVELTVLPVGDGIALCRKL